MTVSAGHKDTTDLVLAALIDEINQKLHAGESVDLPAYAADHPDHAQELEKLLPALELLATLPQANRPAAGQATDSAVPLAAKDASAPLRGMVGEYRVLRELGRGGMGIVYEAQQTSLGRRVALKIFPFAAALDPRHLQRFQNEARAAASLDHPHIVHVHSVGCDRGVHYYAMQYIEGQTLAEVIRQLSRSEGGMLSQRSALGGHAEAPNLDSPRHPVTPSPPHPLTETHPLAALSTQRSTRHPEFFRTVAHLGIQAAEALEHAHQMGVVHRDIKPSNLMVESTLPSPSGRAAALPLPSPSGRGAGGEGRAVQPPHLWITDFGLAMTQTDTNLTMTGDLLGTLRYMSPEQLQAKHALLDHRTDVYSLGLTLYELLTLQPAFPGDDRQDLIRRITQDAPRPPRQLNPAIPKDLETIVLKATAKEPQSRYATAGHLADDLRRFLAREPIRARPPSVVERAEKWARRHRPFIWSAALVLMAMTIGLAVHTLIINRESAKTAEALQAIKQQRARADLQRERANENLRLALEALEQGSLEVIKKQTQSYLTFTQGQLPRQERISEEDAKLLRDMLMLYEECVRANPYEPAVWQGRATAYRRASHLWQMLGMDAEAEQTTQQAIQRAKELVDRFPQVQKYRLCLALAYRERAKLYQSNGEYDKAIADFSESIRLAPKMLDRYHARAVAQRNAGRLAQAVAYCTQAIRLKPNSPMTYTSRGIAYRNIGDFDQAIGDFTEAIRLHPKLATPYWHRAFAHRAQGHFEKALADYRQAAENVEPTDAHSCRLLAWYLATCPDARLQDPARGVELAKKALEMAPWSASCWSTLGVAQCRAGNWQAAIEALERSRELSSGGGVFDWFSLAIAHSKLGHCEEATRWYTQAVEWLETHNPHDVGPRRFRAQAARLLEPTKASADEKDQPTDSQPATD